MSTPARMRFAKWRRGSAAALLLAMCACIPGNAQFAPASNVASVIMQSDAFTCSTPAGAGAFPVNSWSWGDSVDTSLLSGGHVLSLNNFFITKKFDACSVVIARFGASGTVSPAITLKEYDKKKIVLATIVLTNAFVTGYQILASTATTAPSESVYFSFQSIKITNSIGVSFCWDRLTNSATCLP